MDKQINAQKRQIDTQVGRQKGRLIDKQIERQKYKNMNKRKKYI